MIVVSDASPLNYLILIGEVDLLQRLYAQVIIPPAVYDELRQDGAPLAVRQWINHPPPWLVVYRGPIPVDPVLNRLDPGEREAIALAESLTASALLIDERDGRRMAAQRHLQIIGTLQILAQAAEVGLVELPAALARLQSTTFRISTRLLKTFLDRDAERNAGLTKRPANT